MTFKFVVELLLSIVLELSDRQNNSAIPKKKRKAGAYRSDVRGAKGGKKETNKQNQQQQHQRVKHDLHWSSDWLNEFDFFRFH